MAISDPVADFLTRIRNSVTAGHRYIDVSWSVLKEQGFIENYLVKHESKQRGTIRVFLKYASGRRPVIQGVRRVSKPGLRKYVGYADIPRFYGGMGLSIISTSQGVMAGDEASKRKIGGELLCLVW
jgi:small subunit ribosomal protein S8